MCGEKNTWYGKDIINPSPSGGTVDALDLKSSEGNFVPVRLWFRALHKIIYEFPKRGVIVKNVKVIIVNLNGSGHGSTTEPLVN